MTAHDTEVLLIHGSMHGAWCWANVIVELREAGLPARAIDLPGHGERKDEAARASMATYADTVIDALDGSLSPRTVLVGHSMAGQIVARASKSRPARVQTVVLLNAQVLRNGQTHFGTLSPQRQHEYRLLTREQGGITYKISDDDFHARWLQDLHREDPRVSWALSLSTPQPFRPLIDRAVDQDFADVGVPAVYIRSTNDASSPPMRTQTFLDRLPAGTPVLSVPGGHDCMISEPHAVSSAIAKIANDRSVLDEQ